MTTNIDNRVVKKHPISIDIDEPTPMPMMLVEEIGKGEITIKGEKHEVDVTRNMNGSLLLIRIGKRGFAVNVSEIVQGIGAMIEGETDVQTS